MVQTRLTIQLQTGLHARPAAIFVQEANKFASEVFIEFQTKRINAKSIMGIMSLSLKPNSEILLEAVGTDEEMAIAALADLLSMETIEHLQN